MSNLIEIFSSQPITLFGYVYPYLLTDAFSIPFNNNQ